VKRLAAATAGESIPLPPGATDGRVSLEQAVARRRSCRRFAPDPLTVEQLAQLLWAAQGVTAAPNLRAAQAALGQAFVAAAPVTLVFAAVYDRTTRRYGERGQRYVHLDAGCAAENAHLQAEALDLGSVAVGAFNDDAVAEVLELPEGEHPLYLIPVGRRAGGT